MRRLRASEAGSRDAGAAAAYPQGEGRRESEESLFDSEESLHDAEEGGKTSKADEKTLLRNQKTPSSASETPASDSEAGEKPAPDGMLRNPKREESPSTVRTVLINNNKEVRTVPRARERLELPQAFHQLKREQQTGALLALEQVDDGQRQAVLDEWAARCQASTIRNPAGYLYGIIQKAMRGEFKAWAGQQEGKKNSPPLAPVAGRQAATGKPEAMEKPVEFVDKPAEPEAVQKYLAQLRAILNYR